MGSEALINRCSNVSLDVNASEIGDNGARVQQWEYFATGNQHWEFVDVGGGFFVIRNQESGKALDVHAPDISNNGARVQQWDFLGGLNQQWQKVDLGGGWFWLRNRQSGKALDVHVYDIAKNGAGVQQWDFNGTLNQQWKVGGSGDNRFAFGPFEFNFGISAGHVCTLFERHRVAFSRIGSCGTLSSGEMNNLTQAYQRTIRHNITTDPRVNARAPINGSEIEVNFDVLFPQGETEIAQTLIHEMMHCAGFTHPDRRDPPFGRSCAAPDPAVFDCPFDNGRYYGTPPLRAEFCIAGSQSIAIERARKKAGRESCTIDAQGIATIRTLTTGSASESARTA